MSRVAVITPTFNRDSKILERCIRSVQWQTHTDFVHYICHDGPWEAAQELRDEYANIVWMNTPVRTNTFGAGVRQYVLDQLDNSTDYVVHLDDDNLIFPEFLETHASYLDKHPEVGFSICKIIHNGPLPAHMGAPPKILSGVPPVFRNIDTLQVMVRLEVMKACGWTQHTGNEGYCNDGYTYQRLGEMSCWGAIPSLLGIHI